MSLLVAIAVSATAPARGTSEAAATNLVAKAVRQLYPREAPSCFSFETEERSAKAYDIAVREVHNRRCGGDPSVMPVRDRFRVGRSPIRLWRLDPAQDTYVACRLVRARPICPRLSYE